MSCIRVALLVCGLASAGLAHEGLHEQIVGLTGLIEREPRHAELYLRRGDLYRLHADLDASRADLKRAEELEPGLPGLALTWARLDAEAGELDHALGRLDSLLITHPQDGDALWLRARILVVLGRLDEADLAYAQLIRRLVPPRPEPFLEWARLLGDQGEAGRAAALAALDEGIAALGPVASLQVRAIELETERGDFDAALRRVDTLARQSDRQEYWLARRAELLLLARREGEARETFAAALEAIRNLAPRHRATRAVVALAERIQGQLDALAASVPDKGGKHE